MDHPHIVKLYNAYTDGKLTYLVLEKCNDDIAIQRSIPEGLARSLSYKVLLALSYIHKRNICHIDIKPLNILATATDLKLIDFGYAYDVTGSMKFIPKGTHEYMAPEIFSGFVGTASDMWSFGITLYNWLSGEVPYSGKIEEIYIRARARARAENEAKDKTSLLNFEGTEYCQLNII